MAKIYIDNIEISSESTEAYKIFIEDMGLNNEIHMVNCDIRKGLYVRFEGDNNILNMNSVIARENLYCRYLNVEGIRSGGCEISIQENCYFNGLAYLNTYETTKISIGKDCLFGGNVNFRTSDAHTIYDITTNQRLNKAKDIFIGNHVWVAMDVLFLKGSYVNDDSIVGIKSVVTKRFEDKNICIAGVPAHVTRKNVNWNRVNESCYHC